ncbi:MliC family protein [Kaistella carnis]|uniref:MliC family protein n=1 Tax=Kaistella carnis TaxID=1241979 RepID=UPI0028AA8F96|nr:MliC family protein [Kaistella carnis]
MVSTDVIKTTSTDKDGKTLDMAVDPIKGIATVNFNGETIELVQEKSASGVWFKNDTYELRGKGNDLELTKVGKVVFKHVDDKQNVEAKSANGDVLTMDFNNSDGTVKAYLNGGDQIDLNEEKAASGIWYKNDHYELSGKGDSYELKKDGKTVFKN